MKKIIFFLIILMLCNFVLARDIEVKFPEEVEIGEEFEVSLKLIDFETGAYDVKIEILGNGERIAQIYDEKWKSCYYYIVDVGGLENKFSMRVNKDFEGEADVIVKIRNEKKYDFPGYVINVIEKTEDIKIISKDIEEDLIEEKDEYSLEENEEEIKITGKVVEEDVVEVINLNSNKKEIVYESETEKIKSFLIYSFVVFLMVFGIFFIIKKYKDRKYG